jgi:cell division protein FtsL
MKKKPTTKIPIKQAKARAIDWSNLHDEATAEESNNCHGAAERLRMKAADIENELREAGYPYVSDLLK